MGDSYDPQEVEDRVKAPYCIQPNMQLGCWWGNMQGLNEQANHMGEGGGLDILVPNEGGL